jgi:hypothetical protein
MPLEKGCRVRLKMAKYQAVAGTIKKATGPGEFLVHWDRKNDDNNVTTGRYKVGRLKHADTPNAAAAAPASAPTVVSSSSRGQPAAGNTHNALDSSGEEKSSSDEDDPSAGENSSSDDENGADGDDLSFVEEDAPLVVQDDDSIDEESHLGTGGDFAVETTIRCLVR